MQKAVIASDEKPRPMTSPLEAGTQPPIEAPPEDERPGEERESFGTWLRRQRELREITLREIADTSKIGVRYLQALEEDRFELLPALVFAKGFLRQYARYVGLDPEEAVNFFLDARGQRDDGVDVDVTPRPPRTLATWSYALAALAVAFLLMALVWGLLRLNQDGTVAPAAPQPAAPQPAAAQPAAAGEDGDVAAAPSEQPAAAEATAAAAAPPSAPPLVVTLDFRGNCWVRAAVDGRYREARVYTQGESLQLEAEIQVELELGNVFDVAAEVNGRPFPLHGGSGSPVRRLTIDLETAAPTSSRPGAPAPPASEMADGGL